MGRPSFNPGLRWVANSAGQMTSEAQRLLRSIIDTAFKRTGSDEASVVTGTAGASGNISKWDANGNLVDGGKVAANLLVTGDIGVTIQGYSASLTDIAARWTAASASGPASLDLREDADNGTNRVRITVPASLAADRTFTLPDASVIISAFVATLLDDANAAAFLTTLGIPYEQGAYVPTATAGTNIAALTPATCRYMRLGSFVVVAGRVIVDPTTTGASTFRLSLPVSTDMTSFQQLWGVAVADGFTETWGLTGDASTDDINLFGVAVTASAHNVYLLCVYQKND